MTLTQIKDALRRRRRQSLLASLLVVGLAGGLVHVFSGGQPRRALALTPNVAADTTVRAEATAAEELAAKATLSASLWNTLHHKRGISATQAFSFDNAYYTPLAAPAPTAADVPAADNHGPVRAPVAAPETPTPADRLRQQAASLKVQSIVMAEFPLVVIDGLIYRVGDPVQSFRVAAITRRQIVLQKEDLKITLEFGK